MIGDKYYRYESHLISSGTDEFDNPYGLPTLQIYIPTFEVVKETAKGVWLNVYGRRRFVLTNARKHFACPTKEAALESFIARKRRQLRLLQAQIAHIQSVLERVSDISMISVEPQR